MLRECFQHLGTLERKRISTAPNVVLRLNRGERVEPLPRDLLTAMTYAVRASSIQQYPDYAPFYTRLGLHVGMPPSQLVVGAGIEEFIRTLMFLCCEPKERVAVLWPTCAMYEIYSRAFGLRLMKMLTEPGTQTPMSSLIHVFKAVEGLKLIFIPNPGQPVETCYNLDDLEALAAWTASQGITLAIDEAHYGFGAPTAQALIQRWGHVLVLRTFSKFFGGAGLRVGFAMGQEPLIKALHAVRPSGEITGPSLAMATVALDRFTEFETNALYVIAGRDYLRKAVRSLGLRAWGSFGFSVLIEFASEEVAVLVAHRLEEQGIYVKAGLPPPVEKCMLVACGYVPTMQTFFTALRDVVHNVN